MYNSIRSALNPWSESGVVELIEAFGPGVLAPDAASPGLPYQAQPTTVSSPKRIGAVKLRIGQNILSAKSPKNSGRILPCDVST